jgi:hypothetical protein
MKINATSHFNGTASVDSDSGLLGKFAYIRSYIGAM